MSSLAMLRRLRCETSGVAMLEFGFTLPVVLAVLVYGLEVANMGLSMLRVHQIAATAADNAARVRDSISEADVNEVLIGGKIVGERMDFATRGRIVLSAVTPNGKSGANAGQTIVWQRCTGTLNIEESAARYGAAGKGANDNSLPAIGATSRQIAPSPGTALIFAEVTYQYKPIFSATLLGTSVLRSEASFTVRERNSETLNTVSGTSASVCTKFDA